MTDQFKQFNIIFASMEDEYDYTQSREQRLDRIYGRSIIRGCLMFNDLDLADDPWNYENPKNR